MARLNGYTNQEITELKQGQSVQYYVEGKEEIRGMGKVVYNISEGLGELGVYGINSEDRSPKLRIVPNYLTSNVLIYRTRLNKKFGDIFKSYIKEYNSKLKPTNLNTPKVKTVQLMGEVFLRQLSYSEQPHYTHYDILEHISYKVSGEGSGVLSLEFKIKNNNKVREILSEEMILEQLNDLNEEDSKVRAIFSYLGFRTYLDNHLNQRIKGKAKVRSISRLEDYGGEYDAELTYYIEPVKELDSKEIAGILKQILMI